MKTKVPHRLIFTAMQMGMHKGVEVSHRLCLRSKAIGGACKRSHLTSPDAAAACCCAFLTSLPFFLEASFDSISCQSPLICASHVARSAAGSSVVKYGISRASVAVGRLLGLNDSSASARSSAPSDLTYSLQVARSVQ